MTKRLTRFGYGLGVLAVVSLMSVWLWGCVASPLTPAPTAGPLPTLALPQVEATPVNMLGAPPHVMLESTVWLSDTLTVTMRLSAIPGDYLFTDPVLQIEQAHVAPTSESLAALRSALLNLALAASVTEMLVFSPMAETGAGELLFNPDSTTDNIVAQRVTLVVEW